MEKEFETKATPTTSPDPLPAYGDSEAARGSWSQRLVDSFKRDPNAHVTSGSAGADGGTFDAENAAEHVASSPLQRRLKPRHLQMIAIGGSIGKRLSG